MNAVNNTDGTRAPIEQLAIDYNMPLELAKKLIGKTEGQTGANIGNIVILLHSLRTVLNCMITAEYRKMLMEYLCWVIENYRRDGV